MLQGTIVEESLKDNRILNSFVIKSVRISSAQNPADRWHLHRVEVSEEQIKTLATALKPEKWYMHFWQGDDVIAVFPNAMFKFKHSDNATWSDAIQHGLSLKIPIEQLDFIID